MLEEQNGSKTFIIFELAGTTYAFDSWSDGGARSRLVQQMEMIEEITPVPNAPASVEGVVFSRGRVIPALNLRVRFGFERIPIDLRTRLIVIEVGERNVGLIVDSAREFISIEASAIQPPNEAISGLSGKYIEGIAAVDNRIVLILDLRQVINLAEILIGDQPAPSGAQPAKQG